MARNGWQSVFNLGNILGLLDVVRGCALIGNAGVETGDELDGRRCSQTQRDRHSVEGPHFSQFDEQVSQGWAF